MSLTWFVNGREASGTVYVTGDDEISAVVTVDGTGFTATGGNDKLTADPTDVEYVAKGASELTERTAPSPLRMGPSRMLRSRSSSMRSAVLIPWRSPTTLELVFLRDDLSGTPRNHPGGAFSYLRP